jgi:hypothetical protein
MLIGKPLPFVQNYIGAINDAIKAHCHKKGLSRIQKYWLSFCIMAVLVTNSVCWARFQRAGIGRYSVAALSWMFRKSSIPWEILLRMSICTIIQKYGITEGYLGIDDTDKKRSKSTKKIAHVHKIKDKPSGGYVMGQSIVFLILITPEITIPVGFAFHVPDPVLSAWYKNDKKLKKQGIPPKLRPAKPERNPKHPTMPQIALTLLERFKAEHAGIRIRCIFADALYGTEDFFDQASRIFRNIQVISQIRSNQLIRFRNKKWSVENYFEKFSGTEQTIRVRGDEEIKVTIGSARLHVQAHGKKRFVIALKYAGEDEYRYIIASDLSWRTLDIVETYTLRWLVEVFFQDWKTYEGWGKLTKQPDEDGSSRSLILSLLVDHCLFFHPDQLARFENKLPAFTVGSLATKIKVECMLTAIEEIISSDAPVQRLRDFANSLEKNATILRLSKKHMVGRDLGKFEPVPSLKYRQAV